MTRAAMMRVSKLVRMIGLAGLVTASSIANQEEAIKPKKLVAYTQDFFQGTAHEVDTPKLKGTCYNFEAPVSGNVKSYAVFDLICYFMEGKECQGNYLVKVDALGTEIWGRNDVDNGGHTHEKIGSVHCHDNSVNAHVDTASSPIAPDYSALLFCEKDSKNPECMYVPAHGKCASIPKENGWNFRTIYQPLGHICRYYAEAKDCPGTSVVTFINSRKMPRTRQFSNSVSSQIHAVRCQTRWDVVGLPPYEDPDDDASLDAAIESRQARGTEGLNAGIESRSTTTNPGETTICEMDMDGPNCATISANNACVFFPQGLAYKTHAIYQARGSICKYYKDPCPVSDPTVIIRSTMIPVSMKLQEEIAQRIGYVRCQDQWLATENEGMLELDGTREVLVNHERSEKARTIDDTTVSPQAAHLTVCSLKNFKGLCLGFNKDESCKKAGIEVKSLRVGQGTQCSLFPAPDCNGNPAVVGSKDENQSISEVNYSVQSIKCGPAAVSTKRDSQPRTENVQPAFTQQLVPPEDSPLEVCHDTFMQGKCFYYRDSTGCLPNPFNVDAIKSFTVQVGYQCAFYPGFNCDGNDRGPPYYKGLKTSLVVANDVPFEIRSIKCNPHPQKRDDGDMAATEHGSGKYLMYPGDTTICDVVDYENCHENLNAMSQCTSFDPAAGGPDSLKQFRGAYCKWYRGSECSSEGEDGEPMMVNSWESSVHIPDLGENKNVFKSVECRTHLF